MKVIQKADKGVEAEFFRKHKPQNETNILILWASKRRITDVEEQYAGIMMDSKVTAYI